MPSQTSIRKQQEEITISDKGFVVDDRTGIIVPAPYSTQAGGHNRSQIGGLIGQRLKEMGLGNVFNPGEGYYSFGFMLDRQEGTLIPRFNQKGSIASELFLCALSDGEVGNVGVSPIVYPLLPGVLQAQIAKAMNISLNLTGKKTPVTKAANGLARFNDSPLGFSDSIKQIIYNYRVMNRGQPISTVPIHWAAEEWDAWGMEAIEIDGDRRQYYLNVNWGAQKELTPFLPDPLRCYATGNRNWPYWYHHQNLDGKAAWILLHKSHIIPIVPGKSIHNTIGTSSLWITLGFLSDYFLVIEERAEKKLNKLTSGLIGISGIDQEADDVRADLELAKEEQIKEGTYFGSEYVIFTSDEKDVKFTFLPLRQGDGVDDKLKQEGYEDALALAFGQSLNSIVTRGGMGLGSSQAETSSDDSSDTGVNAIFAAIEHALECIWPRVQIAISLPNNRAKRLNLESFSQFAKGVKDLPENTLTLDEVRAIIDRDILEIPSVEDDDITSTTDGNDPIEDDSGQPAAADDNDQDDSENEQDLERTSKAIIYNFEPFIPIGADDPIPPQESDSESVTDDSFDVKFQDEYDGMLTAETWPDEDEERAEPDSDDTSWFWQFSFLEFLRRKTAGASVDRVDRQETNEVRDTLAQFAIDEQDELALNMSLGDLSLQGWAGGLKEIVHNDFTQAFIMGKGGRDNMAPDDWFWLNLTIQDKFDEIDLLGDSIGQGLYSYAQVANYGANIVSGSVWTYEAANSTLYGLALDQLPSYPGNSLQICRGRCRCVWDLDRQGDIVFCTWVLDPAAQHCISCLNNADRWSPLEIDLAIEN